MSDFAEYMPALPATAQFTLQDGRRFLMSIASQDEHGNMQLGLIADQPPMHRDDFAQLATVVYLDELGRVAKRMTRRAAEAS
jgi:hypothetical protein